MQIDGKNFSIRNWQRGDAISLQKHADDRDVWRNLRDTFPHPYTLDDAHSWIELANIAPVTHFAIIVDGKAAGGIGLKPLDGNHAKSAEIGYWLGRTHWGKGIASSALKLMTEYSFANFDFIRLFALVYEWNPASARVLEKAGYTYEGRLRKSVLKDGQFIDELVYSMIKES